MWKKIGLGVALLLVLGGGLIFIDKPVTGEPLAATSQNQNMAASSNARRNVRHRRRHRRHRRATRSNKNMQ